MADIYQRRLAELQARMAEAGLDLFVFNDADSIYFLAVGDIELSDGAITIDLTEGDVFGENVLSHGDMNDLMAIATSQCLVMALDLRDLNSLIERAPRIGQAIAGLAAERKAAFQA